MYKFVLIGLVALAGIMATFTPVRAEGPGSMPPFRPGGGGIYGKVITVDGQNGVMVLQLFVQVGSVSAPGKVPEQMSQRAVELTEKAKQLKQRIDALANSTNPDDQKTREVMQRILDEGLRTINNLLCWREIAYTVRAADNPNIVGLKRTPVAQMSKGARVRLGAVVDGVVPPDKTPEVVRLNTDMMQEMQEPLGIIRMEPARKEQQRTFYKIVGEVVTLDPLVIAVGKGTTITVQNPTGYGLIQPAPVALRDVAPGTAIRVEAQMRNPLEVGRIQRIMLMVAGEESNPGGGPGMTPR